MSEFDVIITGIGLATVALVIAGRGEQLFKLARRAASYQAVEANRFERQSLVRRQPLD
jgi:hypothetical protein